MVAAIRLDERDGDAEEVAKLLRREDLFLGTVGNDVRDWKDALACFFAHWDGDNGMKD